MKMKIIILIIFCMLGFLCTQWAKNNKIDKPITIECDGGVCDPPEGY